MSKFAPEQICGLEVIWHRMSNALYLHGNTLAKRAGLPWRLHSLSHMTCIIALIVTTEPQASWFNVCLHVVKCRSYRQVQRVEGDMISTYKLLFCNSAYILI